MKKSDPKSRRDFIKTSAFAAVSSTAISLTLPGAYAAGSDTIKVGLIGCGGRGKGAVDNVLNAAQGVKIHALGDAFQDRLDDCVKFLGEKHADKTDAPKGRQFVGFDAYQKVIDSGADYIILATPPGFRPAHLQAAIAAGKNIFTEKPVAVDAPGIRLVLTAAEESAKKNLAIVAGTQRRHQLGYLETMKRVQDGAIGQIVAARCYWNQGSLWKKDRQAGWSDMEWQMRNWLYFTWLSGDHIVEQHIHNIDVINWAMGTHPIRAVGLGGRQQRTDGAYGHIYDHFAVDYEYEGGMHLMSMCRQIPGCENNVSEALVGSKGNCATIDRRLYSITGATAWKFEGKEVDPYVQEHTDLIASIRAGKPLNELKRVTESTLTAIMGRMSTYTGKAVTWETALNSQESLLPAKLDWSSIAVPPVAMPGQTQLL